MCQVVRVIVVSNVLRVPSVFNNRLVAIADHLWLASIFPLLIDLWLLPKVHNLFDRKWQIMSPPEMKEPMEILELPEAVEDSEEAGAASDQEARMAVGQATVEWA